MTAGVMVRIDPSLVAKVKKYQRLLEMEYGMKFSFIKASGIMAKKEIMI